MIATDKRKAIFLLHQEGMGVREIARRLGVSRYVVRTIIGHQGAPPSPRERSDKQPLDEELLRRLYQECHGRMVRLHEKTARFVSGMHVELTGGNPTMRLGAVLIFCGRQWIGSVEAFEKLVKEEMERES
jgi:hypothetical protein